jgi:beta-glucosidase
MNTNFRQIIADMTNEEKVDLLSGKGLWRTATFPRFGIDDFVMTDGTYGVRYSTSQIEQGENWSFKDFISVVNQSAGETQEPPDKTDARGGSEALFSQSKPATCFPNGSNLACSWDLELVYRMGQALGKECQHMGVGLLLGPGINIRRTPLAGRGYEYYAEDPVVSGDIGAALINGLQSEGVGASLKHFACNNSEYRRTEMDSVVDERALREIYLSGFKRAIDKSAPWTVMSSYNLLNGIQTSHNHWLLTEVLRDEWQYDGLVMSDWYGIKNRPKSLLAGNDLAMPETKRDKKDLLDALNQGSIPTKVVDDACYRMLTLIDKVHRHRKPNFNADFNQHHMLAQRIAAESLVLLKNDDDILPICSQKVKRIAVIGKPALEPVIQGSGCATTVPFILDRPLDEIFDIANEQYQVTFAIGAPDDNSTNSDALEKAIATAKQADIAIIFASTAIGEDGENGDRKDLGIIPSHETLIVEIAKVQSNTVVVLANSDAVVMPWINKAKAVIETFFAGQGMGRAVADALFGRVNPSGKLTVTMPNTLEETPSWLTYPGENLRHYYSEGIYVGYRYYDKRNMQPLFPFGFGLSYTTFEYSNLRLSTDTLTEGQRVSVSVNVTNTGKYGGKEVIQLYVSPPESRLARESKALKAFAKIEVQPGETQTATMELNWADFAYYDPSFQDWIVESGDYQLLAAKSSRHIELIKTLSIHATPRYPELKEDASVVQLIQNPHAFDRVCRLVADKSQVPAEIVKQKLTEVAPDLFCGLLIALTDMFELDIDRRELIDVLKQP